MNIIKNLRATVRDRWRWRWINFWQQLRRLLWVRLLHVADECMGCGRIMPREWRDSARHLHFFGQRHFPVVLCQQCGSRESILEQFFDPLFGENDYYEDEDDPETACVVCGVQGNDTCCCCGHTLCSMHFEVNAGFCDDCPTEEWIAEQST